MEKYNLILKRRREFLTERQKSSETLIKAFDSKSEKIISEFSQLDYMETAKDIVKIKKLYGDIFFLARTFHIQGTRYYQNNQLAEFIRDKLEKFRRFFYNKKSHEHSNWWQWEIGIPLLLNDIIILMKDELSMEEIKENLETTKYFQPDPRYSGNNPVAIHPSGTPFRISTGGNRVDTVKISFFRGVILQDEEEIRSAIDALPEVWKYVDERDGFYKDGSFIQHDSIPYAGGYGEVLLKGIGEIFYVIQDTEFEKEIQNIGTLYDIILNSFEPFFYNGRFTDMLSGRGIDRVNNSDAVVGHRILNNILMVSAAFEKSKREKVEEIVRREIEKYGREKYLNEEESPFMYQLLSEFLSEEKEKVEYRRELRVFNSMDRIMRRQEKYAIGIAMHSSSIGNYEAMNGENLRGWYTGDGAYYLYDEESNYSDYWQNTDMYFIPGTTEIKMNMEGIDAQRNFETSFVTDKRAGGVSIGNCGVGAMEFLNWNEELESRKSWFFIESGVIFAESEIKGKGRVYTTIFNRKYDRVPEIKIDGINFEGIEFFGKVKVIEIGRYKVSFYKEENINILLEEKAGYTFIKIWKEYGENPSREIFVWGLFHREVEKEWNSIKLTLNEKEHLLEDGSYCYGVNWRQEEDKGEFCTIKKL